MDTRSRVYKESDPRQDYSRIQRKPTNKWTIRQHLTLAFLGSTYDNPWPELTPIFNKYFATELPTAEGLTSGALSWMFMDIQQGVAGKTAMRLLRSTAFSFATGPTYVDQDSIEQTANELGIHLIKKPPGWSSKRLRPRKERRNVKRKAVDDDTDTTSYLPKKDPARRTPERQRRPPSIPHTLSSHDVVGGEAGPPTPPPSIQKPGLQPRSIAKIFPRLAFRAWSSQSYGINSIEGFVAGAYVGVSTFALPPPPDARSQWYRKEAMRHVSPVPSGPTSLISVCRSPIRALHIALRKAKADPERGAFVAVLNLHDVDGENCGRVQDARQLELPIDYNPSGEFLIFGKIDSSSIISIIPLGQLVAAMPSIPGNPDPFQIDALRQAKHLSSARSSILRYRLPMSYATGQAIGKLVRVLGIPCQPSMGIWEAAVNIITRDWRVQGLHHWRDWSDNESFRNGVVGGCQSQEGGRFNHLDLDKVADVTSGMRVERDADEDTFIREFMSDMMKYIDTPEAESCLSGESSPDVFIKAGVIENDIQRDPKAVNSANGDPSFQLVAGESTARQNEGVQEVFNSAAVKYVAPLTELQCNDNVIGRGSVRNECYGKTYSLRRSPPVHVLVTEACHKGPSWSYESRMTRESIQESLPSEPRRMEVVPLHNTAAPQRPKLLEKSCKFSIEGNLADESPGRAREHLKMDTLPIRAPRGAVPNGEYEQRNAIQIGHEPTEASQLSPPSDFQRSTQRNREDMVYEYSWTGM